ncbi:MAG: CPBP family intramembrane metalloprotease [Anaerolineales bacterium]|nr:CPBP family intramembrane metalloprotease [Anaerolineales bacterium]
MKRFLGWVFETGLRFDWKVVTITIVSTLLLMVDHYFRLTAAWLDAPWWKYVDRMILYFVIPMVFIMVVFRDKPRDYGFRLGDWKAGIVLTLGGIVLMAPVLWFLTRGDGTMREYYEPFVSYLPGSTFLDLFGWEFIFRGWILFGYARKFGPEALWLQAVPFALAHIGKPAVETLSTIFGGFAFGWVAYRTRSFLYPFLIHWFIASFTILVAAGVFG